ncbi:ParB-like nuclease domain containing protein [Halalkaliarchaeum sp. AArc-CO]|uniref:hypothetical protein n=1 Tax=Halalkaliarchaeum sp. AArc-CO TaxID=2866381 RepID=UPI00217E9063|nr:hypothetical protein [Halalkaliarchaeum sp. AArc-CO]UWG50007.1 ParB-like nuclease domain containing protein [Halalkaliarchaeum sp. AArc-CO]
MQTGNVKRAFELLLDGGFVELATASNRFVSHWIRDSLLSVEKYYLQRKWGESYPDPYRLIYANPKDVEYYLLNSDNTDFHLGEELEDDIKEFHQTEQARFSGRFNLGKIVGGDWDRHKREWENHDLFRSLRSVYEHGEDWENTEFIQLCLNRIERGYKTYGYSTKDGFLENRTDYIDFLYQDIKENGYKTQDEARDDHRNEDIFHEVTVNIGRHGELIFNNESGQHRLCLAKILDVSKIPLLVIVRHEQWQKLRYDIFKNGLPETHAHLRDHPDLQDILE